MKDRDKIANMLQNHIMELVKFLREKLGYDFKLTHNGIASEIRKSDTFKVLSDDGWRIGMTKKIDKTWSIKHEGKLNKNNIIFRDKKYAKIVKEMKKIDDKLGK